MSRDNLSQEAVPGVIEAAPCAMIDLASSDQKRCLRILHIDDDPSLLEVTKQILSTENDFEIDSVASVDEALEEMEKQAYDAVVCDYEMPVKNGLEFLKELRERKNEIPFILFTGKGREEIVIKALNLGADGYINKNGSPETVYCELAHYIRQNVEKKDALKKAEQDLKDSEDKYKVLFEQANDYILVLEVHRDGVPTIFEANDSALQFHGYSRDEVIGKPITFLDSESTSQVIMERVKHLLNDEKLIFEARHRRKDGTNLNVEVSIKKAKVGSKTFLLSVERDITNRKKVEDDFKKEYGMLEAVTKSIGAGFVIISKDYHILWANNFIREYKGDVDGKLCYAVLNTLDAPCVDCGVTKVFAETATEDAHDYFSTKVDGQPYWVNIIATPIKDSNGKIIAASELCVDITEKKQREKEIEGSQQEFKALFNSNPEAVTYADESNLIVDVNPKFTEVFGYSPEEVKGKNLTEVLVPENLRQETKMQIEKSLTHSVGFNSKTKCKNGSLLDVYTSIAPVLVSGKRIGSVAVYKDMSAIVAAEHKIEAALEQAQVLNEKLNVIGSFTRHDVNNKLAVIKGNIYLANKNAHENPSLQNNIDQINQATDNIARILEFAKNYESLGNEQRTCVNVGKAIDEAVSLFTDFKGVKIINSCKDFNVLADSMLTTVFHNLIDNSLKYGGNLTQIEIQTREENDGSRTIIYEDNGTGIDQETKKYLFNKGFGKGTGYGLYLIRRTCDIYGWKVQETGELGKGARFEFNVPANKQLKENRPTIKT